MTKVNFLFLLHIQSSRSTRVKRLYILRLSDINRYRRGRVNRSNYYMGLCQFHNKYQLILLQKRAIRIINKSNKFDHTAPLFLKNSVLPISKLFQFCVCIQMFKVHHETVPQTIASMFTKRYTTSNCESRQSNHFHIPRVKNTQAKNSIYYSGPALFNKLCTDMGPY